MRCGGAGSDRGECWGGMLENTCVNKLYVKQKQGWARTHLPLGMSRDQVPCIPVLCPVLPGMNDGCDLTAQQSNSEVPVEPHRDAVPRTQIRDKLGDLKSFLTMNQCLKICFKYL